MTRAAAVGVALFLLASGVWPAPVLRQSASETGTELVLYTGGAATALVRQSWMVRLPRGACALSFAWESDNIDAATVRLQVPETVAVGERIHPAGADKTLQWAVSSETGGVVPVTLAYQLAGVKWTPTYRLAWKPGSYEATLTGYVTVTNDSGMELAGLNVQIVLGRPGVAAIDGAQLQTHLLPDLHELPLGAAVRTAFLPPTPLGARQIHRIDSERAPEQVRRILAVQPPSAGVLAREPLPAGPVTVVWEQEGRRIETAGAQLDYQPGEEFEIDLGEAREVLVRRRLLERSKVALEFDRLGRVSGFDTIERYQLDVHNRGASDVDLQVIETVLGTWEFETSALHVMEAGRALMHLRLAAGEAGSLSFTLTKHSGTRIPR
ncbi:MAG: hypothetical protein AB7Y46_07560 [Armatimonadota bacterium]